MPLLAIMFRFSCINNQREEKIKIQKIKNNRSQSINEEKKLARLTHLQLLKLGRSKHYFELYSAG